MRGALPRSRGPCPQRSSPRSASAPHAAHVRCVRAALAGNLRAASCPPFALAPFTRDVAAESGFSYHQQSGHPPISDKNQPVGDVAAAKSRAKRALSWPIKPFGSSGAIHLRKSMVGEPRFRGSISPYRPTPTCLGPSWPSHRPAPAHGGLLAHVRGPLDAYAKGPWFYSPGFLAELEERPRRSARPPLRSPSRDCSARPRPCLLPALLYPRSASTSSSWAFERTPTLV